MMLHVGCLPLFPSYFVSTNRSAVGQYASLDLRRSMDDVIGDYGKETLRRLMRKRATLLVREETVEETQAATKKKARKKL